jgi:GrpB-like predicted nucleotidyltransferase (UPF0157 family)
LKRAVLEFKYWRGFSLQNLLSLANKTMLASEYDESWTTKNKTESEVIRIALGVDKEDE